jgi:MFS family permease
MGIGAAIFIGGGVLHLVQAGALAGTALASQAPWRLVLILIGAPGLLWALAILIIREPVRRTTPNVQGRTGISGNALGLPTPDIRWTQSIPIYLVVAMASLVDNAVGAWAPTLLIREFHRNAADVGLELGLLLTAGFGGGVLAGGWLADRAGERRGWSGKLLVCLVAGAILIPITLCINLGRFEPVLLAVPVYFALSGVVTACGFSAILDAVPNRFRGLAMSVSFFLNVALGAGVGPTAVALAAAHVFDSHAGLAPAISLTVAAGYGIAIAALLVALSKFRLKSSKA